MIPSVFKNAAIWYKLWHKLPDMPDKTLERGRKYKEIVFDCEGETGCVWFDSSFTYNDHRRPFGVLEIYAFVRHPSFQNISFYITFRERLRHGPYVKGDNIKFERYHSRVLPHVKKDDIESVEHFLTLLLLTNTA